MTNNYATIQNEYVSEKFYLVTLNPKRSVIDELNNLGSYLYICSAENLIVTNVYVDDVECTYQTGVLGNFEYIVVNDLLLIQLPADKSNYSNVIIHHLLFYTNGINRYAYQTPDDDTTPLRFYNARLVNNPEFSITQEDLIDRVFTIGNTNVEIDNTDNDFNKYLGDNDSFKFTPVNIWRCLDKIENIRKVYQGYCADISIGSNVSLSVDDAFAPINDIVHSNDTYFKSSFNSTWYPNVKSENKDRPIYKMYSICSKTTMKPFSSLNFDSFSLQNYYNIESGYQLVNTNYSASRSTTTNREWSACFKSAASSDLTETISGTQTVILNFRYRITVADKLKYRPGDNVLVNGNYGFWVYYIDFSSNDNYIYIFCNSAFAIADGQTILRKTIPAISVIDSDYVYNLIYGRDYTLSIDANDVYKITFVNNFEANYSSGPLFASGLNQDSTIYYRVYNHDDLNHGTVIKSLLENVGIACDATSFSNLNLTVFKTNFSIPFFGEENFINLRDILQRLLTSTFAHLLVNENFECEYKFIDNPLPSLTITESEIMGSGLSQSIKYSDITTDLFFNNIHGEDIFAYDLVSTINYLKTLSESYVTNTKNKYLYDVNNSKTINHLVFKMDNSKFRILNVLSNRRHSVEFTTKGINFSSKVGDDITIVSDEIIGGSGSKDFKILSIKQTASETTIRAVDLLGL